MAEPNLELDGDDDEVPVLEDANEAEWREAEAKRRRRRIRILLGGLVVVCLLCGGLVIVAPIYAESRKTALVAFDQLVGFAADQAELRAQVYRVHGQGDEEGQGKHWLTFSQDVKGGWHPGLELNPLGDVFTDPQGVVKLPCRMPAVSSTLYFVVEDSGTVYGNRDGALVAVYREKVPLLVVETNTLLPSVPDERDEFDWDRPVIPEGALAALRGAAARGTAIAYAALDINRPRDYPLVRLWLRPRRDLPNFLDPTVLPLGPVLGRYNWEAGGTVDRARAFLIRDLKEFNSAPGQAKKDVRLITVVTADAAAAAEYARHGFRTLLLSEDPTDLVGVDRFHSWKFIALP